MLVSSCVCGRAGKNPLPLVPVILKPFTQKLKFVRELASQRHKTQTALEKHKTQTQKVLDEMNKKISQTALEKHKTQTAKVLDEMNSKVPKQIFKRVLVELQLKTSTKVSMATNSEQQKGNDVNIQMSKETLKTMVDVDSTSGNATSSVVEKPDLDGNATKKFIKLAKQAGIQKSILRGFKFTEEQPVQNKKGNSDNESSEKNETGTGVEENVKVMTLSITRSRTQRMEAKPIFGDMEVRTLRRLNTI